MKTSKILILVLFFLAVTSCKKETKAPVEEAKSTETVAVIESDFNVIPAESYIKWKADKIVGGHEGQFLVADGTISTSDNAIKNGVVNFDIKSLHILDIPKEDENYAKLSGHLLGEDFFDSENHPKASFEITGMDQDNMNGNLTIKGITKNITFPINTEVTDAGITITSEPFTIDRTQWDIKFNSGKFFDVNELGDFLIKDDIEITVNIKGTKK